MSPIRKVTGRKDVRRDITITGIEVSEIRQIIHEILCDLNEECRRKTPWGTDGNFSTPILGYGSFSYELKDGGARYVSIDTSDDYLHAKPDDTILSMWTNHLVGSPEAEQLFSRIQSEYVNRESTRFQFRK
jgi:hypothetical protein